MSKPEHLRLISNEEASPPAYEDPLIGKTLEDRYKGLRSPHKLKFAVSGCTRECAEAQSKDVGVIAT